MMDESAGGTMTDLKTVTKPNMANVSREKRINQSNTFVVVQASLTIAATFRVRRNRKNLANATIRRLLRGSTGHSPARNLVAHSIPPTGRVNK